MKTAGKKARWLLLLGLLSVLDTVAWSGEPEQKVITNTIGMELALIPAGQIKVSGTFFG